MKSFKTLTVMAAAALALSALPQVALGAFSDSITVYNANGTIKAVINAEEADELVAGGNIFGMDTGVANQAMYLSPTIVYEENPDGTAGNTLISDIFGVAQIPGGSGNFYLAFMSEVGETPLTIAAAEVYFGLYNATWRIVHEQWNPTLVESWDAQAYVMPAYNLGGTAQFVSAVPEPTTMIAGALLLLPFGASTLRMLRKNRTA